MRALVVVLLLAATAAADPQITDVQQVDATNPRSVDAAAKAAEALGDAGRADAIAPLAELAQKPPTKQLIVAQIAAIRALGKLGAKAAPSLRAIATRARPATKDETELALHFSVAGASINALGELRDPASAKALIAAMYVNPELMTQARRALVATGKTAEQELRSALRGTNKEVNALFAKYKLDRSCDGGDCMPISAKAFYAAVVLGDFYDPAVVPDLLAALKGKPLPSYYADGQPSQSTQYHAIYDALRKIGDPSAAAVVRARWATGDVASRALAIAAYPFMARDDAGVDELGKIMADNDADDTLRQESATAYARLAHDTSRIAPLQDLAQKYLDASAKKRAEADGAPKRDADAADKELEVAKKKLEAAKQKALATARDNTTTVDQIKAATLAAKQAEDDFKLAKQKHRDAVRPYREADAAAKAYRGYARMFQTHIARIEIAARCKDDLACYANALAPTVDPGAGLATYIPDLAAWNMEEKQGLREGAIERAMLELRKRGTKAERYTQALLDAVHSQDRLIRQSILLALTKIAKLPCDACVAGLDKVIAADEAQHIAHADLTLETTLVRNYFTAAR